ncbi:O-antigen polymerase [Streptococcus halotolerans]|uniref:O-antigen polymerase n=1 Tax=Streptococcus halotolerans TaxID=1814128 RepID=UPI0009EF5542|nr:O-antigen polymerase [Streptococcus halotolerans]
MTLLLVLFISLLILFFLVYILSQRDILSPPVVMLGMFIISTIFALINAKNWQIDYSFLATFYITSGIVVFSLPILFMANKIPSISEKITNSKVDIATWKVVFAIISDIVIVYLFRKEMLQLAAQAGYRGQSLQWFIRNTTNYEGVLEFSSSIRLLVRFVDITAYIFMFTLIDKFIYNNKKGKDLLLIIPVLIFIYKTSLTGGRQDILKLVFAGIVQTYILQKTKTGWNKVISGKYIFVGLSGILVGIPSFYYGLFLVGRTTTRTMMESVSTYIGGPIQHFNQYIQHPISPSRYFGSETFVPILNMLGDAGFIDYKATVHLEFRQLGVTIGNVYTFFRRPLHDFGPIGMYLFVFSIGLFFGFLYYIVIRSKSRSTLWDINVMVYSYLFYWIFLSSIEQYSMTIISVFTLIAIILFYLLSVFYWQFKFTPTGFAFINNDDEIEREEI